MNRRGDANFFFTDRVNQTDFTAVQAYRFIGIGSRRAIFEIAFDNTTNGSQLDADLMRSAG